MKDMYSIDLAKITLDEFEKILCAVQLLPSQKLILDNLHGNMQKLKAKGVAHLQELQSLLKKKNDYPQIAGETGIDEEYLVILNRMVNSYVVKALPLEKLGIFSKEELDVLSRETIVNTKQYYEVFTAAGQMEKLSVGLNIPGRKLNYALHIVDLLRINGVGIEYAKILYDVGIKSVADYNKTSSETILESVKAANKNNAYTKATLGISDVDYCRRFCRKLDCDIMS